VLSVALPADNEAWASRKGGLRKEAREARGFRSSTGVSWTGAGLRGPPFPERSVPFEEEDESRFVGLLPVEAA
jgi:hypothetical protein